MFVRYKGRERNVSVPAAEPENETEIVLDAETRSAPTAPSENAAAKDATATNESEPVACSLTETAKV
jgi:hypothetical protein